MLSSRGELPSTLISMSPVPSSEVPLMVLMFWLLPLSTSVFCLLVTNSLIPPTMVLVVVVRVLSLIFCFVLIVVTFSLMAPTIVLFVVVKVLSVMFCFRASCVST